MKNINDIKGLVEAIFHKERQLTQVECDVLQLIAEALPVMRFERIKADNVELDSQRGVFLYISEDRSDRAGVIDKDEVFLFEDGTLHYYNYGYAQILGHCIYSYKGQIQPKEISYDQLYDCLLRIIGDYDKSLLERIEVSKNAPSMDSAS